MKSGKTLKIISGTKYDPSDLVFDLDRFCYERKEIVTSGSFSLHGGNLTVFPVNSTRPVRIEFFGSTVENIFIFDQSTGKKLESFDRLSIFPNYIILTDSVKILPGQYVVHEDHGIGLFSHQETKNVEGNDQSYIVLSYLNNDELFVPVELYDKITSYVGVGRRSPKLSKLGSQTWKRTYQKTYDNIILLAKELLEIYAKREISFRKPFKFFSDWDKEVDKTFGYNLTDDQKRAVEEVLSDLKKNHPVDRLICGDVGFGKTEVAIRMIVQTIANGFQVAMLVPTTILAEQHFSVIKKRLSKLPIKVSHLSRFVEKKEQQETIEKIKTGEIDLVIATHRIFSSDIDFKNLGLLVIDEEQKFGVKDKEKLKKLRTSLDVLSLTATPIPRTFFMALSGIRDLTAINSAPAGRKEIKTEISKYDEDKIKFYTEREISRGGQVYYLHNEVATIEGAKNKIQKLFPKLRIETGHGQQSENHLAKIMSEFSEGKIDILVCSTIIENGLDLPNANTLIVDDSDRFGLSQLYQIRGRIGRSPAQAYALFLHKDKKITDNAFKRLKALAEFTELGSGYRIALNDLEIRGGGNILGREQHGNMEAIGLVLYTRLLNEATKRLKSGQ